MKTNGYAPGHHWFTIDGVKLHYLAWGDRTRPVLVLLHGGGQSAHTWQRVAARLAPHYRVLAPDACGHGESEWSPDGQYSLERFCADLHGFVTALRLGRFVLVGMSLGGMTALAYAGRYGELLRGLVVVDIAPEVQPEGKERVLGFMQGRESFASLEDAVEYAHAYNPRRSREVLRQTLPRNLRTLPDGRLRWKWDPVMFKHAARLAASVDALWQDAARVPCPTLVVHGVESDILSAAAGQRLATVLPQGRYLAVTSAGHSVQGDNPQSLADVLEDFLSQLAG